MRAEKDFAGRQSRGTRPSQEDAYAFSDIVDGTGHASGLLIVLADGMGGHKAGEHASELAVKNCMAKFHESEGTIADRLDRGLNAANESIAAELVRDFSLDGMGTTLLAAAVNDTGLQWISVGDSPLYLWRDGKLSRLNEDHSLRPVLKQLAEQGAAMDPAESARSRNVLRAALTGHEIALIDRSRGPFELQRGDMIIAATDGIHSLSEETMLQICAETATFDASMAASKFIETIREASHPKQDNTTIMIVKT